MEGGPSSRPSLTHCAAAAEAPHCPHVLLAGWLAAGFILARRLTWVWAVLGIAGSVVLSSSGFVLQTKGLKSGNTVVGEGCRECCH